MDQFVKVLNSKKRKIRRLQKEIQKAGKADEGV